MVFNHAAEGVIGTVVTPGASQRNIAQRRGAKAIFVGHIARHIKAAKVVPVIQPIAFTVANLGHGNGVEAHIGLKFTTVATRALRGAVEQTHTALCRR